MKKYLVEFIGTFFLVLTIGMTVVGNDPIDHLPPLAIGAALAVMIFAGGHVSGGHYNPAVTLAVWLRGRCSASDIPGYWLAQVGGAAAASFLVMELKNHPTMHPGDLNISHALIAEFVGTFALAWVVLNVATAKGTANNSFYGLAIGFTVMAMAFALGGVSGGAFNPAVAIGVTIMGLAKAGSLWVYLVGNFAAAAVAALIFKVVTPDDK